LLGGVFTLAAATVAANFWWATPSQADSSVLTAPEAYAAMQAGELILVDVRRPEEWQMTGIAEGAVPLDMRRRDFLVELDRLSGPDRDVPIAIICRTGNRTGYLMSELVPRGFANVRNVSEGMMGSQAGKGWLAHGLPIERL
jgi:rhodanese-related sulfurtransferase